MSFITADNSACISGSMTCRFRECTVRRPTKGCDLFVLWQDFGEIANHLLLGRRISAAELLGTHIRLALVVGHPAHIPPLPIDRHFAIVRQILQLIHRAPHLCLYFRRQAVQAFQLFEPSLLLSRRELLEILYALFNIGPLRRRQLRQSLFPLLRRHSLQLVEKLFAPLLIGLLLLPCLGERRRRQRRSQQRRRRQQNRTCAQSGHYIVFEPTISNWSRS